MTMTADDEILREFLVESHENLDKLDREFVALETNPDDVARIGAIFRTIHTIKGTSGFLGFSRLEALTHVGESLLAKLRDRQLALSPEITTALLCMVDGVRAILTNVERTSGEGTEEYVELRETLAALSVPGGKPKAPAPAPETAKAVAAAPAAPAPAAPAPVASHPAVRAADKPEAPHHEEETVDARAASVADTSIRVDVGLLDKLMNLVGELVLARNQILQFSATTREAALIGTSQRINLITTELQEGVMKTRMQPIGNIWNKFPRVVRDLALQCGKHVRIEMEGKETDLDRTIIEAIKDPLTHIVRNAVDHGIESPEARRARGKDPTGTLLLRAYHAGGQVNIEIGDDGAGLDPERIRKKGVERGLVGAEQAARMTERELIGLIFLPGFSTAEKVTNVSGRGVGMDVVKTNIEKIGGTLDIESAVGAGTTLKIKIPLTLAIIPALVVTSRAERFAIPQVSLLELVRLEAEQAKTSIEYVYGTPVYRLRGSLLPIVFLPRALGEDNIESQSPDGSVNIVVLQADGRPFGLVVDGVNDTEEIVVKPLGKELKGLNVFAGATIMGDGRVALILDVLGLAQRANLAGARERVERTREERARDEDKETLLLFRAGEGTTKNEDGRCMAVPLSMVARLEEFPRERVERAGRRPVVQYRGEIMPLIDLGEVLAQRQARAGEEPLQVIVTSHGERSVGLIVDRIVDIVEERLAVKDKGRQKGVLGAAVVQGKVTELLDVEGIIRSAEPQFFEHA